jgi:predicted Zn-dependent protease with MMP-like domain
MASPAGDILGRSRRRGGYDRFVHIEEFEREVEVVLARLPEWVKEAMDNVYVVVERRPSKAQDPTGEGLLGLYEGVSLDERGFDYFGVAPDSIFVFYEPHMALGLTGQALRDEIRTTVLHELGHHLGMTDERLHELGWA